MVKKFIRQAIRRPGRVHKYLLKEYGKAAFHEDGTIKMEYLDMAAKRAKMRKETSLERAILLAKRLKG